MLDTANHSSVPRLDVLELTMASLLPMTLTDIPNLCIIKILGEAIATSALR